MWRHFPGPNSNESFTQIKALSPSKYFRKNSERWTFLLLVFMRSMGERAVKYDGRFSQERLVYISGSNVYAVWTFEFLFWRKLFCGWWHLPQFLQIKCWSISHVMDTSPRAFVVRHFSRLFLHKRRLNNWLIWNLKKYSWSGAKYSKNLMCYLTFLISLTQNG